MYEAKIYTTALCSNAIIEYTKAAEELADNNNGVITKDQLSELQHQMLVDVHDKIYQDAIIVAQDNKNIKMKPIPYEGSFLCPSCEKSLPKPKFRFCPFCAQRIDWR